MEEKEKSLFLPKGTDGRYKDIMILHLQGMLVILVLLVALAAASSIMVRTIFSLFVFPSGRLATPEEFEYVFESIYGMGKIASTIAKLAKSVYSMIGVLDYIAAFVSLGVSIWIIILMKRRITDIIDTSAPYENPIRIKKAPFVWLGFLLGGFGIHYFAINKTKKALIFLVLGFLGMQIAPLIIYTSGISFADALMACFIEKDEEGFIEMEDYPYWI